MRSIWGQDSSTVFEASSTDAVSSVCSASRLRFCAAAIAWTSVCGSTCMVRRSVPRPVNSSTGVPGLNLRLTARPSLFCLRFFALMNMSVAQPVRSCPSMAVPRGRPTIIFGQSRPSFACNI